MTFAAVATLAFGALSAFAAPLEVDVAADASALIARCNCKSVPSIIADVSVAVSAHVNALRMCSYFPSRLITEGSD